jgi:hypothetical protein
MERTIVVNVLADNGTEELRLSLIDRGGERVIESSRTFSGKQIFAGMDFFEAFQRFRSAVESEGFLILCQGSSRYFRTSPMLKEASKGLKGYSVRIGKSTSRDDVVDLFDAATQDTVVSANEQREYIEKWLKSLKN